MAALSELEKLEARYAENPEGRYFAPFADALRKAGRVDDAIQVVTTGLGKHPDYLSAHIVLGRCFLEKKDDAAARGAFERVLALDSENIIALKSLAEITERMGDTDQARRWLQRLLVIDAMNTEAADDLARLGGPIEGGEGGEGAEARTEAEDVRISFADVAPPEPPAPEPAPVAEETTAVVPAIESIEPVVPRTLERPAVTPEMVKMAQDKTLDMMPAVPAPMPEPEPMSAPTEPVPALDLEPTSFAPPAEEPPREEGLVLDEAPTHELVRPSEALASPMDFMPPPAAEPAADTWAGAPEVPEMDLSAPPAEPIQSIAEPAAGSDLQLIMPEDVTPAEELRRPSIKQVQMVSPEPVEAEPAAAAQMMVTETMGDLYMRQGLKDQAAEVYRQLLRQRPGDAGLQGKLDAIMSPPAYSASAVGSEAVGSWLRRVAKAQLPSAAAEAPPAPPPASESPMEQAFTAPEPEPAAAAAPEAAPAAEATEPAPSGSPARPATDAFSLDQIFGGQPGSSAPSSPPPAPAPTTPLGASFDEFFGAAPKQESVRPSKETPAPGPGGRQSEDDLSAFNAWLHGLKR